MYVRQYCTNINVTMEEQKKYLKHSSIKLQNLTHAVFTEDTTNLKPQMRRHQTSHYRNVNKGRFPRKYCRLYIQLITFKLLS